MKQNLARGVAWVAGARILVNLIGLASTLLLARLLVPDDFGLCAVASTIVAIVGAITELPLGAALVQHRSPTEQHFDTAFTLGLIRSSGLAIIIALIAWPLSVIYQEPRLFYVVIVIAASSALSGMVNPRLVILTRRLSFWQDFLMQVSTKIFGFVIAIFLAVTFRTYWALVLSGVGSQILNVILSYLFIPYRPRLSLYHWRELMNYSIWMTFGNAVNAINWRSDSLFIGYMLGNGPLGYYTFGDNLASLPTREASAPIAQTLFPAFSRLQDDLPRLRAAYQNSQALLCAIVLPLGFGFAVLAKPLIAATVGAKWMPASLIVQVLAGVFALQTLSSAVHPLAMALGETRLMFRRDLYNFAIRLPLIIVGLLLGGLSGVVFARFISGNISTIINMTFVKKIIGVSIFDQIAVNMRSFLATAIMSVVIGILLPYLYLCNLGEFEILVCEVVLGGVTYACVLILAWLISGRPMGAETELLSLLKKILAIHRSLKI